MTTASAFYAAYLIFAMFECTIYVVVSILLWLAWRQARGKRRSDFLVWLTPLAVGSVLATTLTVWLLLRLLLRVRFTMASYEVEWAMQTVLMLINTYSTIRLWQVLRNAPIYLGALPQVEETPVSSEVWPPPPTQKS